MDHAHAYTAGELATMLGVDRKTVYVAAKLGQLPHRRLGRRIVFPKAAVDDWLASAPMAISVPASPRSPGTRRRVSPARLSSRRSSDTARRKRGK